MRKLLGRSTHAFSRGPQLHWRSGLTIRIWWILVFGLLTIISWAQGTNTITEIELRGLQNVNREQILAVMRTKVGQPYVQSQLDQDRRSIEDIGFFQAVDVRASEQGDQNWKIIVEVSEFPKIKEVRIVGNSVVSTDEISKALAESGGFAVVAGNVYNLKSARPSADAIEKLYTSKGYFARVSEFGPLRDNQEVINVVLLELTVNQVLVQGNKRTKKGVLDKIIRTKPGQPFNSDIARQDYRRLFETQWFEEIRIVDRQTDDPGKIDLVFDVKEAQTGQLNFGVQVDPRSSFAGLLRYGDVNFRGTGTSLNANIVQGSKGGTSLDIDYGNPYVDSKGTAMNASIYSRVVFRFTGTGFGTDGTDPTSPTNDTFYERRTGASFALSRRFKETQSETLFGSMAIRFESIKTSDIDAKANEGFIQQDGDLATIAFGLTRDKRDVAIDASQGDWLRLSLEPGYSRITKVGGELPSEDLLGSNTFFRTNLEYRRYFNLQGPRDRTKLDEPRRVVAVRARAGSISGKVPFFEQFFVGGSDTLRGYQEDRFWGRNFASLSLEYRHPIQKSFNAILFADYGSAWGGYGTVGEFSQTNKPDFKIGYGAGFSFRTPLGPIRLDFGFNEKGQSRTHFLIGTSF